MLIPLREQELRAHRARGAVREHAEPRKLAKPACRQGGTNRRSVGRLDGLCICLTCTASTAMMAALAEPGSRALFCDRTVRSETLAPHGCRYDAAQGRAAGKPHGRSVGGQVRRLTHRWPHAPPAARGPNRAAFSWPAPGRQKSWDGRQEERDGYQSGLRYRPSAGGRCNRS